MKNTNTRSCGMSTAVINNSVERLNRYMAQLHALDGREDNRDSRSFLEAGEDKMQAFTASGILCL